MSACRHHVLAGGHRWTIQQVPPAGPDAAGHAKGALRVEEKLQTHTVSSVIRKCHSFLNAAAGLAEDPLHQRRKASGKEANQASVAVMGNEMVERVAEARGEARRLARNGRV